jgi:hypothetical protein
LLTVTYVKYISQLSLKLHKSNNHPTVLQLYLPLLFNYNAINMSIDELTRRAIKGAKPKKNTYIQSDTFAWRMTHKLLVLTLAALAVYTGGVAHYNGQVRCQRDNKDAPIAHMEYCTDRIFVVQRKKELHNLYESMPGLGPVIESDGDVIREYRRMFHVIMLFLTGVIVFSMPYSAWRKYEGPGFNKDVMESLEP